MIKKVFAIALILILALAAINCFATTYYVDANGGLNTNAGTSTGTAWQTLAKVNLFTFASGDWILLKQGETFYGNIIISGAGLNFGSYGTGAKPIITGLSTITGWVNLGGNIWEAPTVNVKVKNNLVTKDGVMKAVGRYPNANATNGGYIATTASTTTSVTTPMLSTTTNWTGAEIVTRFVRWDVAIETITSHSGNVITFPSFGKAPIVGFGVFIQRDSRTLDQDGEWWQDGTNSKLRMYFSDNNPSAHIIKAATVDTLLRSVYGSLLVRDIKFYGSGKFGIRCSGGANIRVANCDFELSGDEAIFLKSQTFNAQIDSCTALNSYGSGFRINTAGSSGTYNMAVTNCNVTNTALFIGMSPSTEEGNGGWGIQCKIGTADSVRVINNRVINSGYCGMEWQGNHAYIKNNFVDTFCSVRDDGGGIYTVENGGSTLPTRNTRYVVGNIVSNGIGALAGTTGTFESGVCGIYFDLGTRTLVADSNTIFNIPGNGFHGNNNQNITVTNNTTFNTSFNYSTQRFSDGLLVRGMRIVKNIFYPYRLQYRNLAINLPTLLTMQADLLAIGILDSNYYSTKSGIDTSLNAVTTYSTGSNYAQSYNNFSYLKGTVGQETHSVNVVNYGTLEYNASNIAKIVNFLGLRKKDVYGNIYDNSVTIPAWGSKILILIGFVPAPNPPVANAGADQTITLPTSSVSITGSATTSGTIASTLWTKISGPTSGTILSPTTLTTSVTSLVQGVYLFQFKATDNLGAIGYDTMQVTVNPAPVNPPPVVNAGVDKNITLPTTTVSVTATATDDGSISSTLWTFVSGPATATFSASTSLTTNINNLTIAGTYVIKFTATDNLGASSSDFMQVFVAAANIAPVANAGVDQIITLPTNTATLVGSGSDVDGTITTYAWIKLSGPAGSITSPSSATTGLTGLTIAGNYLFQLTVTDNNGATGSDVMQLTVNPSIPPANIPPTANAGITQVITLPTNFVIVTGTASTDPDGTIVAYQWTKVSGGSATITTPTFVSTSITGLTVGLYQFRLRVTDNIGDTGIATVSVTVNAQNIPPTVDAGVDKIITLPTNIVNLFATVSDVDGTIASTLWTKLSGPSGGIIALPNSVTTDIFSLTQGVYIYQIRAIDNKGDSATDAVQITVLPQPTPNIAPTANAGSDFAIQFPSTTAVLNGYGIDTDGYIFSYRWDLISSPTGVIPFIQSPSSNITGITGLNGLGDYVFRLTVTDNKGGVGFDYVTITVAGLTGGGGKIILTN